MMAEINLHHNGMYPAACDWDSVPELKLIQGGAKGVVLSSKGNYRTAFVEVLADGTFIRGEGETIEEAELNAWNKWIKRSTCINHEWEARGYKNGLGICKNCNTSQAGVISAEELGLFCHECGIPTFDTSDDDMLVWGCEAHPVRNLSLEKLIKDIAGEEAEEKLRRSNNND